MKLAKPAGVLAWAFGRLCAVSAVTVSAAGSVGRTTVSASGGGSSGSASRSGVTSTSVASIDTVSATTSSTSAPPPGYTVPEVSCDASLCQPSCNTSADGGRGTTISGIVYDPAGINPIPHVYVYVADPRVALPDLGTISRCDCSSLYPPNELASATSGVDGTFIIPKAPSGIGFTIVIQAGRWRRAFGPVTLNACVDNQLGK